MAWTKAKTAIVVGVGVLLVAGTTITVVKTKLGGTQNAVFMKEMPRSRAACSGSQAE